MIPQLIVLSYSGGSQSHCLLEMVLREEIPKPDPFLVLNSDPGMEDERSYAITAAVRERCRHSNIDFITADGPNLYRDLTTFKERGLTRLDNPPFWTRDRVTGKRGRLKQECTNYYKIQPMRRALRKYMEHKFGTPTTTTRNLPKVEMWIGFSGDEQDRIDGRKSEVKFISERFPLAEMGMTKAKVAGWYLQRGITSPPRSVCAACFANGLAYFEDMYINRPNDWDKAVAVDEAIRDMDQAGVEDECFVSSTLIPLRELAERNFMAGTPERKEHICNSGVCFV